MIHDIKRKTQRILTYLFFSILVLNITSCTQEDIEDEFITVPATFIGVWMFESEDGSRNGRLTISKNNIIEEFNVLDNSTTLDYERVYNTSDFIVIEIDFVNGNGTPRYIVRVADSENEGEVIFERNLSFIEELGGMQVDEPAFIGEIFERIDE